MRGRHEQLRAALRAHAERIIQYQRGELTPDEFRRVRVSYGLYYELEHTSFLQRIKIPGGVLSASQAQVLADVADDYARGRIHVTTRQNVQLHWVNLSSVMEMYERLQSVGITTRGAAGDSVRNVTGCSHAGLWPGELFDVGPYVSAVDAHFLFHRLNFSLPRKFKVAISSCPGDCVQARINDIGLFPHRRDGRDGFSVYVAGGLGAQPFLGRALRAFVPAEDVLIIVEAVLSVWSRSGERMNRKKARVKHLFQRMGAERFTAAVEEQGAAIGAERGQVLRGQVRAALAAGTAGHPSRPPSSLPHSDDPDFARWMQTNVFQQKQEGYYAATLLLPMGEITGAQLRGAATLASALGGGELRATTDQNLLVPWIPGARVHEAYRWLRALDLADAGALGMADVVSCPGGDYCSLAITRSMKMANAIRQHLRDGDSDGADLGAFRIRVSGCPNACGQHHTGDIGLTGLAVKGADGAPRACYSMLLGGRAGEGTAAIGQRVPGRFPEEQVPPPIAALAAHYRRERRADECFGDFVARIGVPRLAQVMRSACGSGIIEAVT